MSDDAPSGEHPTRDRITDAAVALFLEGGTDALTMRAVARRAGIGTMTTYRHFENREALVAELVAVGFDRFRPHFYTALDADTPYRQLWTCAQHYLAFALENPRFYELMFNDPRPLASLPLAETTRRKIAEPLHFLTERVQACRTDMDWADARVHALRLWSVSHGMVALRLANRYDANVDFETFYTTTIGVLLGALGLSDDD